MKKLLYSDRLRAVQFTGNTGAKSVTPVQITDQVVILDYDWQEDRENFFRPMISCKATTKILYGNSEKRFLECEKKWLQETSSGTFSVPVFSCLHYFK